MRTTVAAGVALSAVALTAPVAVAQQRQPLRKADLVRLLTVPRLSKSEIATVVRRGCLNFEPSARDRSDLLALGADSAIMRGIDECLRRRARDLPAPTGQGGGPRVTPPPDRRPAPRPPPVVMPPASPRSAVVPSPTRAAPPSVRRASAAQRSAFVSGGGQRGQVGTELPRPLVFEVRDTTNFPVPDQDVTFAAANARVTPQRAVTDSLGQVRLTVVLGVRAQPATIHARTAGMERHVSVLAVPGPPVRLIVSCGAEPVARRVILRAGGVARLEVVAQDALGNDVAVKALRAAVGEEGMVRVTTVTSEGNRGVLMLEARGPGSTSLAVIASGLREDVTVLVSTAGPIGCRL